MSVLNVLTTAALLEAASAGDAAEARQLRELQSRGKIVPNAKLLELALGAVRGSSGPHVLCEFPRAMDQLTQLEAAAGEVAAGAWRSTRRSPRTSWRCANT